MPARSTQFLSFYTYKGVPIQEVPGLRKYVVGPVARMTLLLYDMGVRATPQKNL
jgi:hypothetical protein